MNTTIKVSDWLQPATIRLLIESEVSAHTGRASAILDCISRGETRRAQIANIIRACGVSCNTGAIGKGVALCNAALKEGKGLPSINEIAEAIEVGNATHRQNQAKYLESLKTPPPAPPAPPAPTPGKKPGKKPGNDNLNALKDALKDPILFGTEEDIIRAIQLLEDWIADARAVIAKP